MPAFHDDLDRQADAWDMQDVGTAITINGVVYTAAIDFTGIREVWNPNTGLKEYRQSCWVHLRKALLAQQPSRTDTFVVNSISTWTLADSWEEPVQWRFQLTRLVNR